MRVSPPLFGSALIAAAAGLALLLLGVYGRFNGDPSIWIGEAKLSGQTFLLLANSALLMRGETIGNLTGPQNICQGETATWRIGVGDMFTAPPVTLSAAGEPAGTTASFSTNPVAPVVLPQAVEPELPGVRVVRVAQAPVEEAGAVGKPVGALHLPRNLLREPRPVGDVEHVQHVVLVPAPEESEGQVVAVPGPG